MSKKSNILLNGIKVGEADITSNPELNSITSKKSAGWDNLLLDIAFGYEPTPADIGNEIGYKIADKLSTKDDLNEFIWGIKHGIEAHKINHKKS